MLLSLSLNKSMAVEARLFPPHLIQDRELMNAISEGNMRFLGIPSTAENQLYQQAKTDSGLTYNVAAPRKRPRDRDAFNHHEIMPQIYHDQFEIDAIISQHTKKIRYELEERQKQQARLVAAAIGEGVMKKLKEKDEQIQRISKLNLVLQERVKSLYVENQLWRDLAQTNEATANSLRSNLEQVLSVAVEEDVESCCGSREAEAQDKGEDCYGDRRCRRCGERESCVLLLPCRHLCLCSVCGSGSHQLQSCPVCNSTMTATLHVNMS